MSPLHRRLSNDLKQFYTKHINHFQKLIQLVTVFSRLPELTMFTTNAFGRSQHSVERESVKRKKSLVWAGSQLLASIVLQELAS